MRLIGVALVVLMLVCPAFSQTAVPSTPSGPAEASVEAEIHAVENGLFSVVTVAGDAHAARSLLEEMHRLHVPAVSIAVIHDGKLRWAHAWGTLSPNGGPAATVDSLFQAGSISKPLASMAALRLVQEGKLSLDAPVQTELKGWTLPQNAFTAQHPVTLRELLSHTAGINVDWFPGYASTAAVPSLQQVLDGLKPANTAAVRVTAVPGSAYRYSGGGFTIVQQMMIDATGEAFPQIMQSLVLGPVGMKHSTYEEPLPAERLKEVAISVDEQGNPIAGGPHTYPEMAAAGMWTTPSDLALWIVEVQRSLKGQANHVLSPEMTRVMLTPVKGEYALDLRITNQNGQIAFSHRGSDAGYVSFLIGLENGDGAVIMTSGDNGGPLWSEILHGIAKVYGWPVWAPTERTAITLPGSALRAFTGKFTAQSLGPIEITMQDGHLEAQLPSYGTSAIYPASANTFFATETEAELHFDSADAGKVLVDGQSFRFARAK